MHSSGRRRQKSMVRVVLGVVTKARYTSGRSFRRRPASRERLGFTFLHIRVRPFRFVVGSTHAAHLPGGRHADRSLTGRSRKTESRGYYTCCSRGHLSSLSRTSGGLPSTTPVIRNSGHEATCQSVKRVYVPNTCSGHKLSRGQNRESTMVIWRGRHGIPKASSQQPHACLL